MQVKSIAECSTGSILQYFRPSLSYHVSLRSLFCLFLSGRFTQVLLYNIYPKYSDRSDEVRIFHIKLNPYKVNLFIPPANFVCGGYTVFTCPSVHESVPLSVTLCFLTILKSHCWIFIKPCEHVHICKTNTFNKKLMASSKWLFV